MSKQIKKSLAPKLRFPEFRDAGEWKKTTLDNYADFYKGKFLPKSAIHDSAKFKCIHYGELFTHYPEKIKVVKSRTNQPIATSFLSKNNDVLMPTSDVTPDGLAKASCIFEDDVILGGDILVIRSKKNNFINGVFLSYFIRFNKKEIMKRVTGTTVYHLYASDLKSFPVILPPFNEQKAIADCLSSVDELITAQTQKTDALKAHKKGLMQKLFPAEGETVPKLRFPKFRDAGEWEEMRLGDVMDIIGGGTPKTNIPEYWNGDIPWLSTPDFANSNRWVDKSSKSITELGLKNSATKLLRQGDVIISARGTVGALAQLRKPMAFSQTNYGLRANPELINNAFLFYAIKEKVKNLKRFSYGAVFDTITTKTFDQIDISLPSLSEQKAITDCLSSIDDLITAQTQKIDALKAHKKGLMQKLFPSN